MRIGGWQMAKGSRKSPGPGLGPLFFLYRCFFLSFILFSFDLAARAEYKNQRLSVPYFLGRKYNIFPRREDREVPVSAEQPVISSDA